MRHTCLLLGVLVALGAMLAGCGTDAAATQTRAAELRQIATLTAPTATSAATATTPPLSIAPTVVQVFPTATATSAPPTAEPPHIVATMANTPVPFARFTAADVVAEFRKYGLYAVDPHPLPRDFWPVYLSNAPLGSGQVSSFFQEGRDLTIAFVITFTSASDMEASWQSLQANSFGGAFNKPEYLRNANVILCFLVPNKNPPDLSAYRAAFVGMR